ncbi:DUF6266 family protein [Proteiniphilum saccharofermentans]|uniref:DUF6266 family protein n=1 Tax=Proteiniphilum saccharofermentans TaxID=1642647 RepID=UPI0028AC3E73|nr:DUF6266 family protein [Proteiniphilum saccharofermentans]
MGSIDLSKLAGLSGKIGPIVVYVTKGGKQVYRRHVTPVNPRTPKQVAQRAKFTLATKALSPLNKVIKRGYPGSENTFRKLIGKAYHEAITGEYPHYAIDYSQIQIAGGNLQLPTDIRLRVDPRSGTTVLSWNPLRVWSSLPGSDNDMVYIVCFNSDKPLEVQTLKQGTRAAGQTSIKIPKGWKPETTHWWLYLTSHDMQDNSNSMYLSAE